MKNATINYLEIPACDLLKVKKFFSLVFGWSFKDYGKEYVAFFNAGIEGGFFYSKQCMQTSKGSALIVFYSDDLLLMQEHIIKGGGLICKDLFSFPGGCRFHFLDPCGNEYAVWSESA